MGKTKVRIGRIMVQELNNMFSFCAPQSEQAGDLRTFRREGALEILSEIWWEKVK